MTRKELYSKIKSLHLENEVMKTFGDNYTRVSNYNLENLVAKKESSLKKSSCNNTTDFKNVIIRIVSTLQGNNVIDVEDAKFILGGL